MVWVINVFFGCKHPRYTWPRLHKPSGQHYVACLHCGAQLQYNWTQLGTVRQVKVGRPLQLVAAQAVVGSACPARGQLNPTRVAS